MKNTLLAANWKSNKNKNEARNWIFEVSRQKFPENLEVVIFPPSTLLDFLDSFIKANDLPFKLGAQNLSPFESGAYTGEISALQIKEFADYVLIGHSERRTNFEESNELVKKKIDQALNGNLTPIVCLSTLEQSQGLTSEKIIFAYEPPTAISTSGPGVEAENPKNVSVFAEKLKEKIRSRIMYGGSVGPSNIKSYASLENISGVLVGGQSLEADSFIKLIKNAI